MEYRSQGHSQQTRASELQAALWAADNGGLTAHCVKKAELESVKSPLRQQRKWGERWPSTGFRAYTASPTIFHPENYTFSPDAEPQTTDQLE